MYSSQLLFQFLHRVIVTGAVIAAVFLGVRYAFNLEENPEEKMVTIIDDSWMVNITIT